MDFIGFGAAFLVGVFAAFIGAMVGGGGLISIPFLIFLGLPPQVAIATNKFGAVGLRFGAFTKFYKTKHILWKYFIPFAVLSFVAAIIGAQILLAIDKSFLSRIVAIILIVVLPFIFFQKDMGVEHRVTSSIKQGFGYVLYFLVQIFGGFFGGGGALFLYYVLMSFFGMTIIEASATTKLPGVLMTLTALIIFGFNGILNYWFGAAMFFGMLVGGWLGAHTAIKKGNAWVKSLFAVIVVLSAVKLFFG